MALAVTASQLPSLNKNKSVQLLIVSNFLWPHGLQHTRPPCPSPTPRVYSNSCPLIWWCHPTISSSVVPFSHLQPFSASVFSSESVLHIRWPKYWSFSFSISPSNEYSGLISFRMDLLDLLAVQGTLKSLIQHHSSIKIKWVNIFTLCLLISFFSKEDKCFFLPDKWKFFLLSYPNTLHASSFIFMWFVTSD